MERRIFLKLGAGAAIGSVLAACGGGGDVSTSEPRAQSTRLKVVSGWTNLALQAVRTVKPGPPMAARSLAILATCMYNAWCQYDALARPTRPGQPRRPVAERSDANKAMAISYAAHAALVDQFPTEQAAFDAYLASLNVSQGSTDGGTPAALGLAAARAELDVCHADGANQLGNLTPGAVPYADYTGYVPKNPAMIVSAPTPRELIPAPGHWQPLTYTDAAGVVRTPLFTGAAWSHVTPFALASSDQLRPAPPPAFGSALYEAQVRHIVELQASLTDEQKVIAEYWADGPNSELPPGHWLLFALYVSERDRHTDDDEIKLLFALSNALSDAAVAAWDAKRAYDSVRPISAVRYLLHGQTIPGYGPLGPSGGLRQIQGESWIPYQPMTFPTPAFPEHVSGHSAFSAAAAQVLRSFTGSDLFGASFTKAARSMAIETGAPQAEVVLQWPTFSAAAAQAGLSRIYGGIHFDSGNTAGQTLGQQVGRQAFARAQALWLGNV
ncbi:vanadium-dependent haloperoxidase [Massilia sp. S19_KUP03_FR1]|uniref:vanadium-dependent haloperoxidase n=1 Tax=Massilia sp. S19_KUP03_FR1 TaxID=3025503 RepID=UPI002FCD71EB